MSAWKFEFAGLQSGNAKRLSQVIKVRPLVALMENLVSPRSDFEMLINVNSNMSNG